MLKRVNRNDDGGIELWPDYSVNDYIYRDDELEHMSFYEFVCNYCNNPFTFECMRKRDHTSGLPKLSQDQFAFKEGHPGRRYSCLKNTRCQ